MRKLIILTLLFVVAFTSVSFAKLIKEYYPNGHLQSVTRVDAKGVLNGPYKIYWFNGKLKQTGVYKNGLLVGKQKDYDINGLLMRT